MKLSKLIIIVITALQFGSAEAGTYESRAADAVREKLCKLLPIGSTCEKPSVEVFGPPPPGTVSKEGHTLSITTKRGVKRTWEGNLGEQWEADDKASTYHVKFDQVHQYFCVDGLHYEGGSSEWISYENEGYYQFDDIPIISPNGHFFLTGRVLEDDSVVRVYSVATQEIRKVAEFDIERLWRNDFGKVGDFLWVTDQCIK